MGSSLLRLATAWRAASDADKNILDRLERNILRHSPKSAEEAAIMLDVVAVNVATGQRCDELDVRAVHSVAYWPRTTKDHTDHGRS